MPSAEHLMIPFGDGWHNPNDENHVLSCLVCEETYRKSKDKEVKFDVGHVFAPPKFNSHNSGEPLCCNVIVEDFGANEHASSIPTEGGDAESLSKLLKACCLDCESYLDENHTICCPGYEIGRPGKGLYKYANSMPLQSKEKVLCKYRYRKSRWGSVCSDSDRETEAELESSTASDEESESDCMACKALRLIGEDPSEHQLCPYHGKHSRPGHKPTCCEICVIFYEYASELKERYEDKECDCEGCRILVVIGMDPKEHELCRYRFDEVSEHEAPMCCGVCAGLWTFAGKLEARIAGEDWESELSSNYESYTSGDNESKISNLNHRPAALLPAHPTHRVPYPAHNNPTHHATHAPNAPAAEHACVQPHHHAAHSGHEHSASHSDADPAHHAHHKTHSDLVEHQDTHPTHHIPHAAHANPTEHENIHPPHHALQNTHPHPAGHPGTNPAHHNSHTTNPHPAGLTHPYHPSHPTHGAYPPHPPHALCGPYSHPCAPHPGTHAYHAYPPPPPVQVNVGIPMPFYVPGHPGFPHQQLNPHPHPNPSHVHPQQLEQHQSHPCHVESQHQEHPQSHHGQVNHQHQKHHEHHQPHQKKHDRAASAELSEQDSDCDSDEGMSESSLPTITPLSPNLSKNSLTLACGGHASSVDGYESGEEDHKSRIFSKRAIKALKKQTHCKYSASKSEDPNFLVWLGFYEILLTPHVHADLIKSSLKEAGGTAEHGIKYLLGLVGSGADAYSKPHLGALDYNSIVCHDVCKELRKYHAEKVMASSLGGSSESLNAMRAEYSSHDLAIAENIFRAFEALFPEEGASGVLDRWIEESSELTKIHNLESELERMRTEPLPSSGEETHKDEEFKDKSKGKENIDAVHYEHFNNAVVEDLKKRTKYGSYNAHDPDYYVRCFNAFYNALLSPKVLSREDVKRIITKNCNKAIRNFITLTSRQVYTSLGNSEIDEAIAFIIGCEELIEYVREHQSSRLESEHNSYAGLEMKYNRKDLILSENLLRVLVEMHQGVDIGALLQQWVDEKEKEHITGVYPGVASTPILGSPIYAIPDTGEGPSEAYRGRKGYHKHHNKSHKNSLPSVAESNDFSLPKSRSTTLPQSAEGSLYYNLDTTPPRTKIHTPGYSERSKSLSSSRNRSPQHRRYKVHVPHNYRFSSSPRSSSYSPTHRHHSPSLRRLPSLPPTLIPRYQSRLSKSYVHVMLFHCSSQGQTWHTYDPKCAGCKALDEISSLEKEHGVKFTYAIIKERLAKEYAERAGIWDQRESCELMMGNVGDAGALPQKLRSRLSSARDEQERKQIWEDHNRIMMQYDAAFVRLEISEVKLIELENRAKVFIPYLNDVELREKTGCQEIHHHKRRHGNEKEEESSLVDTSDDSLADEYSHRSISRSASLTGNSDRPHSIRQHSPASWRPSDIFHPQFQARPLQRTHTNEERDGMEYFIQSARCSQALKDTEKKHQDLAKHCWSSSCLGCEQLNWLADLELENHSPDKMRERVQQAMFDLDNDILACVNKQPYDCEARKKRIKEAAWLQNLRDMLQEYIRASFSEAEKSAQFGSDSQPLFATLPFTGIGSTHHDRAHLINAHWLSPRDRPTGAFPRGKFSGFPSDKIPHSRPGDEFRRKMGIPTRPTPRSYSPIREASSFSTHRPLTPTNTALPHHDRHTSFHSSTIPRPAPGDEIHHLLRQSLGHGTQHKYPTRQAHHTHNTHHNHRAHHTHPRLIPQPHSPIQVSFRARGNRIHTSNSEARGAH